MLIGVLQQNESERRRRYNAARRKPRADSSSHPTPSAGIAWKMARRTKGRGIKDGGLGDDAFFLQQIGGAARGALIDPFLLMPDRMRAMLILILGAVVSELIVSFLEQAYVI